MISLGVDMYRYLNLRGVESDPSFASAMPGMPANYPDDETDGRHFVFVHGYNVNADQSRDWARAMFKRLWWAGLKSKFIAVDWFGDDSQLPVPVGQLTLVGGAWKIQELTKGTTLWNDINVGTFGTQRVSCEGGWGINTRYALDPTWYIYQYGFLMRAQTMTRQMAIEHPPFTPFRTEEDAMHSTNSFVIVDAGYAASLKAKFLADAIPAESFAAGAKPLGGGTGSDCSAANELAAIASRPTTSAALIVFRVIILPFVLLRRQDNPAF